MWNEVFPSRRFVNGERKPVQEIKVMPEHIMEAIRQYFELEPDDTSKDESIKKMSARATLDAFLSWEGIQGYTDDILVIMNSKIGKS
jgi:hypothetical protein